MIDRLSLRLFKCFESLSLPLAPLTLLSGTNSSGKSSVIQSLVLLQQTMIEHEWSTRLLLNGESLQLGTVADVVDQVNGRRTFGIAVEHEGVNIEWAFSGERTDMSLGVDHVSIGKSSFSTPQTLRYLLPNDAQKSVSTFAKRLRDANYLTAERIGPREVYSLEDPETTRNIGRAGEHAASLLFWSRDKHVLPELCLPESPSTLLRQVEARMQTFFPGCGLELTPIPQVNSVTLGLRTSEDTGFHRPTNVGFGLTQVFPIVVAALSATAGDLLLIENPEVHLHPAGQSLMGQFLADVAAAGVQVLVESHSDHVLNGLRRSVRSGHVNADAVAVHFFRARGQEFPQVVTPTMDRHGSVDTWPPGFFDQFDRDVNYLAGWGD